MDNLTTAAFISACVYLSIVGVMVAWLLASLVLDYLRDDLQELEGEKNFWNSQDERCE